jgi:hypothetical protein
MSDRLYDRRIDNYFRIENAIFERNDLNTYEKLVYILLCRYANNNNGAFPSYETIAKGVSTSRRKAIDVVRNLVEKKLIEKGERFIKGKNERTSNIYYVLTCITITSEQYAPPSEQYAPPSEQYAPPSEQYAPPSEQYAPYKQQGSKNNVSKNNIINNNNSETARNYQNENNVVVVNSPDDIKLFKKEIIEKFEATYKAKLNPKRVDEMLKKKGADIVNKYLAEYGDYIQGRDIKNLAGDFYSCVMNEYEKPVGKTSPMASGSYGRYSGHLVEYNGKMVPPYAAFEQREFTDEEYESFYTNVMED